MRILVVEDEPRLLRNLAKALREEGYAVDIADAGDDGLYKAETFNYDAIVLDVMLPRLDGWEILARLRKQKQTPVLMLTARDTHKDRVRGLDNGADDYLVKPFDLSELLARLRALIRRAAGQARPLIELGDVVIDTRARTSVSLASFKSCPSMSTRPLHGSKNRGVSEISVLLPAPVGPTSASICPAPTSSVTSFKTAVPWLYPNVTCSQAIVQPPP